MQIQLCFLASGRGPSFVISISGTDNKGKYQLGDAGVHKRYTISKNIRKSDFLHVDWLNSFNTGAYFFLSGYVFMVYLMRCNSEKPTNIQLRRKSYIK